MNGITLALTLTLTLTLTLPLPLTLTLTLTLPLTLTITLTRTLILTLTFTLTLTLTLLLSYFYSYSCFLNVLRALASATLIFPQHIEVCSKGRKLIHKPFTILHTHFMGSFSPIVNCPPFCTRLVGVYNNRPLFLCSLSQLDVIPLFPPPRELGWEVAPPPHLCSRTSVAANFPWEGRLFTMGLFILERW